MSATIINLIIQIIAGAIGGNAAGAGMEKANLGTAGNTIAGALGGLGGGQILSALILRQLQVLRAEPTLSQSWANWSAVA